MGFELRVGRFQRLAGSEFQTDGSTKLNEHSPTDFILRFRIFESFSLEDRRVREFVILICFRGKLKGKRGVGVVSPVTVRNRSCHLVLGSGILQAAPNAVHSTAVCVM